MPFKIKIVKNTTINDKTLKKGDCLVVSRSIRNSMIESGVAKDYQEKENKKKK